MGAAASALPIPQQQHSTDDAGNEGLVAPSAASFANRLPDDVITKLLPLLTLPDTRALLLTARSSAATARAAMLAAARETLRRALCGAPDLSRPAPPGVAPHVVAAARALLQRELSAVQRERAALAVLALCVHTGSAGESSDGGSSDDGDDERGSEGDSVPSSLRLLQLLLHGADPDLCEDGTTPLHWAVRHGRAEMAVLLLAAGAAAELKDGSGRTPQQLALDQEAAAGLGDDSYRRLARKMPRTLPAKLSAAELLEIAKGKEAAMAEKAGKLKVIQRDLNEVLGEALPGLDAAVKCLFTIRKGEMTELRCFVRPPASMKLTAEMLCHMLEMKPDLRKDPDNPGRLLADYWPVFQKHPPPCGLGGGFVGRLAEYDKDNIPQLFMIKMKPYMELENEDFTPEVVARTSKPCTAFCMWCRAMYNYHATVVVPLKEAQEAQASLMEAMAQLADAQGRLKAEEDRVAGLDAPGHALSAAEAAAFRAEAHGLRLHANARGSLALLLGQVTGTRPLVGSFGSKGGMIRCRDQAAARRFQMTIHAKLDEADALLLKQGTGAAPAGEKAFGLELFPPRSTVAGAFSYFEGMLKYGFDASVAGSISAASRCEGAFAPLPPLPASHLEAVSALAGWRTVECATHALAAKEPWSQRTMDACVSFRRLLLRENALGVEMHVYEVLFMAVHENAKRRGIASRLVSALRQRLLQEAAGAPAALCVSIKSASAEARSFWMHAGLAKLDGVRAPAPVSDAEAAVVRAMVPFDDFTPFGALAGGAARRCSAAAGSAGDSAAADFDAATAQRALGVLTKYENREGCARTIWGAYFGAAQSTTGTASHRDATKELAEARAFHQSTCPLRNSLEQLERCSSGYCAGVAALGQHAVDGVHLAAQLERGGFSTLGAFCAAVRGALASTLALATGTRHSSALVTQAVRAFTRIQMCTFEAMMGHRAWAGLPDAERWHCDATLVVLLSIDGAQSFAKPVALLLQGDKQREAYARAVPQPMDMGTITTKLHTGRYSTRAAFTADVRLMLDNCQRYWSRPEFMVDGRSVGEPYVACATTMRVQLEAAVRTEAANRIPHGAAGPAPSAVSPLAAAHLAYDLATVDRVTRLTRARTAFVESPEFEACVREVCFPQSSQDHGDGPVSRNSSGGSAKFRMGSTCDHLPAILAELESVLPSRPLDASLAGCTIVLGGDPHAETFVCTVTSSSLQLTPAALFDTAEKWVDEALDHVSLSTVCPDDVTGVIETMRITFKVGDDLRATNITAAITRADALQSLIDYYNAT
jgi:GNAT superfamily N-acetyltransferase